MPETDLYIMQLHMWRQHISAGPDGENLKPEPSSGNRSLAQRLGLAVLCACSAWVSAADYKIVTLAENLVQPWSLAFLPDGSMLVTELEGRLRRLSADGELGEPIEGVPDVLYASQGGLFDVVLHPKFERNGLLFLSFAQGEPTLNATRVVRARLEGNKLVNLREVITLDEKFAPAHYGGRMLFDNDGRLLLTSGDGFDLREEAQNLGSLLGKVLRLDVDGTAPLDNPFVGEEGARREVYTYGHRNPQGLTLDRISGAVVLHEHGPRGGDEVNVLQAGKNYGWPAITHGIDYTGAHVSPFKEWPGMEQPLHVWVPSIAPSGLAVYRGKIFPQWRGDLLVGALVDREVRRLTMQDGKIVSEESMFAELDARIRDVRVDHAGYIYLLTDGRGDGKVLRVEADGS